MDESAEKNRQLSVLLVEDNADHAELITRCLADLDFGGPLFHVRDGEEALDFLQRNGKYREPETSPRPALILMDLRLPRLDGLSLLRRIKSSESLQSIPVVILTTSAANRDIESAYAAQANAYLTKPLNFTEFRSHLHAAAKFWLKCNVTPCPDATQ